MRQQPTSDESWSEGDAVRLVRGLGRTAGTQAGDHGAARHQILARTMGDEVIPRLVKVRRLLGAAPAATVQDITTAPDLDGFVDLLLHGTQAATTAYVESLCAAGTSIESLYLGLLTSAARRLGVMWEEDSCDFSEVTLGVLRLGNVLRMLGRVFAGHYMPGAMGPSALLAQMPGEQHGLGLAMVVQFFRRAGWFVCDSPLATSGELIDAVRGRWFGVVGLSVSCDDRLELLASDIRAIRRHSRNPKVGVMVGGPPFVAHPQLAAMVGADATAMDGRQAVLQAESLISLLARDR